MGETLGGVPSAVGSYVAENPDDALRWMGVVNSLAGGPRSVSSAAPITAAMLEYGMSKPRQDAFTNAIKSQEMLKQNPYGEFGESLALSKPEQAVLTRGAPRSPSAGFNYAASAVSQNVAEAKADKQKQLMRPLPTLPQVGAPPPQRPSSRYLLGPPGEYSKPSSSDQIAQLLAARFPKHLLMQSPEEGSQSF